MKAEEHAATPEKKDESKSAAQETAGELKIQTIKATETHAVATNTVAEADHPQTLDAQAEGKAHMEAVAAADGAMLVR